MDRFNPENRRRRMRLESRVRNFHFSYFIFSFFHSVFPHINDVSVLCCLRIGLHGIPIYTHTRRVFVHIIYMCIQHTIVVHSGEMLFERFIFCLARCAFSVTIGMPTLFHVRRNIFCFVRLFSSLLPFFSCFFRFLVFLCCMSVCVCWLA